MKKTILKLFALLIALTMIFCLAACNDNTWVIKNMNNRIVQLEQDLEELKKQMETMDEDGTGGLSAYEIFKKHYPDYRGSEKQWIDDYVSGNLAAFTMGLHFYLFDSGSAYGVSGHWQNMDEMIVIPAIFNGLPVMRIMDFSHCSNLKSILIPDGITSISGYAFSNCISLQNITIPATVTSIGNRAFEKCTSLESVIFENDSQLDYIGEYAFNNCISLKSITIPSTVIRFELGAFIKCKSLKTVTFESGSQLEYIYPWAFSYCESLETITIPASIRRFGERLFWNCKGLKNVIFEEGSPIYSIEAYTFEHGESLESVTIPATVRIIGYSAFWDCYALTDIFYGGADIFKWNEINTNETNDSFLKNATIYFYSQTEVTGGTHWRYVNGIPTVWE